MKMKRISLKTLSLMAGVVLAASCSSHDDPAIAGIETVDDGAPLEIRLGSGLMTRASHSGSGAGPIVQDDNLSNVGIAGWETNGDSFTAYGSQAAKWNTTISFIVHPTEQKVVTFLQKQYYAQNGDKTFMKAWYPVGTPTFSASEAKTTFTNSDGTLDVLLAEPISGSRTDATGKNLAFKHMTSQIVFKVQAGDGMDADTQIESITIKDAQLPTGFDLSKGMTDPETVTWNTASDLSAQVTKATITSTATKVGKELMIKPFTGKTFNIDVKTSKNTFNNVQVTIEDSNDNMQAGTAYEVTLTVKQAEIQLTATVTDWVQGTGSGEIM